MVLSVEVKSKEQVDPLLMEMVLGKINESFSQWGMVRYQGRLYVPDVDYLRNWILEKAHGSRYFIHLRATKM